MTEEELNKKQQELDYKKWLQSEDAKKDLSGDYEYCFYCNGCNLDNGKCVLSQQERVALHACATAWEYMTRGVIDYAKPNKRTSRTKGKRTKNAN